MAEVTLNPRDRDLLRQMRRWQQNFRVIGADFQNSPEQATLRVPAPRPAPPAAPGRDPLWVKVTGNTLNGVALGGGKYAGVILTGTSTIAANSTDLTMPEGMTVPGVNDCMIANLAESGTSLHSLTHASNPSPYFRGWISHTTPAGGTDYPVVVIDAARGWAC
jgi:hypothetical protein